jgi:2-dehydro-3-deoxygluconokinase
MEQTSEQLQVITLGEALIVFDPLSKGLLRHVETFTKRLGGAELNVAVALARLGHHAGWAGAVGADEFGREIVAFLRGEGVDVTRAHLDQKAPTGLYFKERRALDRLRAYYYRAGSAASLHRFEDLDVDYLLSAEILHLTGITPALSEGCRDLIERLMDLAIVRGVPISFDSNIRWRLFNGRGPRETLAPLLARADLLFLSHEEAELFLDGSDPESTRKFRENVRAEVVVVHSPSGSFAVDRHGVTEKAAYPVEVIDTVGAGDAFVAGFLSGRLRGWDLGKSLELANACGACAVSVPGDAASMPTEDDALSLLHNRRVIER